MAASENALGTLCACAGKEAGAEMIVVVLVRRIDLGAEDTERSGCVKCWKGCFVPGGVHFVLLSLPIYY
jgi:hypothetical protein